MSVFVIDVTARVVRYLSDAGGMWLMLEHSLDGRRWELLTVFEPVIADTVVPDNASEELVALARTGDRDAFDALAACLMPPESVAECWAGTRVRLGLAP